MGAYHGAYWDPEFKEGLSRSQRWRGSYEFYVPGKLCNMDIDLDLDVLNDLMRAQSDLRELDTRIEHLQDTDGLARLLLRSEAVSSSFIEGLSVGVMRLLRSELDHSGDLWTHDETAAAVLSNIEAMKHAVLDASLSDRLSVEDILDIHRALCANTPLEPYGGMLKTYQNWVGGNSYNLKDADYIPPAPEYVEELLEDIAMFCDRPDVPSVLKAALVHAQFESVHPFVDGNGRCGRALIHTVLRRSEPDLSFVPPVSLIMATHSKSYTSALNGFRFDDADTLAAHRGINEWVSFFAGAVSSACAEAFRIEEDRRELIRSWKQRLGSVRAGSAADLLLDRMVGQPLFTIKEAAEDIGRSIPATSAAVNALLEAGIIETVSAKNRNRVFKAPDAVNMMNIIERRFASPAGDTSIAEPARVVPANRDRKGN